MPSPFPGMNPYLERVAVWDSFHPHFITTAFAQLAAQVRPKYVVDIETRLYIHEPPADRRYRTTTDLGVTGPGSGTSGATATIAPLYLTLADAVEIESVGFLTIRERAGDEVVTALELLSRSNKYAGEDRVQYLGNRAELLRSRTHPVEIDLLRGGPRMPPDELPTCDYYAVVSRVEERPRVGV